MHKKVIRGTVYYYTSVRENGRVKTIYLGRNEKEALKRERGMKSEGKFTFVNSRFLTYLFMIIFIAVGLFLFRGAIVGYIAVEGPGAYSPGEKLTGAVNITFQSEELYPEGSEVEISIGEQTIRMGLPEFLSEAGGEIDSGSGEYYVSGSELSGQGKGFGIPGEKIVYPEISFSCILNCYNFSDNETVQESFLVEGICSLETPHVEKIPENLTNCSVSIVLGSVYLGNVTVNESFVLAGIQDGSVIVTTDYFEVIQGMGKGFESDQERYFSLNIEKLNLTTPEEGGEYVLDVRVVYNETVLEGTEKNITVSIPVLPPPEEIPEENVTPPIVPEVNDTDGDGDPDITDCDPQNPSIHHGAKEICDDGVDNDCDGFIDNEDPECLCEDNDGDGYNTCEPEMDCDDSDPEVNPKAKEICDDGKDNDCDGLIDSEDIKCKIVCEDNDKDKYNTCEEPVDCDDSDPGINPGMNETCDDGKDNDCDGFIDSEDTECKEGCEDKDGDGYDTCTEPIDCDDTNPAINPEAEEICGNLIDEDCDGFDEICMVTLSDVIASKKIKFVREEVGEEISRSEQARIIIKLKDISKKSKIGKEISPKREVKGFVSAVVSEEELVNVLNKFSEDEIELIQLDHPIELVLDDVVNQTGVEMAWDLNVTGKDQTVCVLDSGIDYNHPNLSGNYIGGYDFVNDDNDPADDNGHGTYVSGIVTGIAKDSKILAVKVFGSDGKGYESDIIAGIDYCVNNKDTYNISAMLMSFGGWIFNPYCYCDSNLVANDSNFAVSQGIFSVAASGNDGDPYLKAPACGTNVTSVGAVDKNDNVAEFSNVDPLLDLLAPGVAVRSAQMGGGFVTKNGTSASAAVVAGIASLVLENESLAPLDLQYRLRSTGFLVNHSGKKYPRVDAYSALTNNVTNTPVERQGLQCEGNWEEYEELLEQCPIETECSSPDDCDCCGNEMGESEGPFFCTDWDCIEMSPGNCGGIPYCSCVKGQCYAECSNDGNCPSDSCSGACPGCTYNDSFCDDWTDCSCQWNPLDPDSNTGICTGGACCTGCSEAWFSSVSKCCGDDAGEDFNGSATDGCCCNEIQIANSTDDALCSGLNWCIDGTYCTGGVVYDDSLTATAGTYTLSGDDIICGCCANCGDKCDNDDDGTAEGLCASSSCDTGLVALSGGNYDSGCSAGHECDSDVTPSEHTPQYDRDGWCHGSSSTTCCTSTIASGEQTGGSANWGDGDEVCTCASSGGAADGEICDSTAISGPSSEGICVDQASNTCRLNGNAVAKSGSNYYSSCTNGYECDTSLASATYTRDGYCCSGCKADYSVAHGGACCGVDALCDDTIPSSCRAADNTCGYNNGQSCTDGDDCDSDLCVNSYCRASCDGYSGYGCSTDGNAYTSPSAGTCYDDLSTTYGCDYSGELRMNCSAGASCDHGTDASYATCDSSSGDSCDSDVGGIFAQDGMCAATSAGGGSPTCDTAGFVCLDDLGIYYYTDSVASSYCSSGAHCDESFTDGDFSAGTKRYDPDDGSHCDDCDNGYIGEDGQCERACGAGSNCDERSPGGWWCSASHVIEACCEGTSNCEYRTTTCADYEECEYTNSYDSDCGGDADCDEHTPQDYCPTMGTWCNSSCDEVDRDTSQTACTDSGGNCDAKTWSSTYSCCNGDDVSDDCDEDSDCNGECSSSCQCTLNCDAHSDCDSDYYCSSGGTCTAKVGLGVACADASVIDSDSDAMCSDSSYSMSCYTGYNNDCQGAAAATSGYCRRDPGQSCTYGNDCGVGVCTEGTCNTKSGAACASGSCGDECSYDGTDYSTHDYNMFSQNNEGCGYEPGPTCADDGSRNNCGTGDNYDSDCQASCYSGTTFCSNFDSGKCIDTTVSDNACGGCTNDCEGLAHVDGTDPTCTSSQCNYVDCADDYADTNNDDGCSYGSCDGCEDYCEDNDQYVDDNTFSDYDTSTGLSCDAASNVDCPSSGCLDLEISAPTTITTGDCIADTGTDTIGGETKVCCSGDWIRASCSGTSCSDDGAASDCCSDSECSTDTCVSGQATFRDYSCSSYSCGYNDYDRDTASGYCTSSSGDCVAQTWFSSVSACCGNNGTSDDFNGSATDGCCCDGSAIATGNDAICTGHPSGNYWCLDGTYCTSESGLVRDPDEGGSSVGGDNVACGCLYTAEYICDDNDADSTADGMCGSGVGCTTGTFSFASGTYYSGCANARECDSNIASPTAYDYVRDGYCITSTCYADGSRSEGESCSNDAHCSDATYYRSCYSGYNITCGGFNGSTSGECRRDNGQACMKGDQCGSGVCTDGTCNAPSDSSGTRCTVYTCGLACSANGSDYTEGNQQMHGPTNYGCSQNMPINEYTANLGSCGSVGSGDNRDADCQANCNSGLTYIDTACDGYPYSCGRCIDLISYGNSCCQHRNASWGGGVGGGDCDTGLNCTDGICKYISGQSCTSGDNCSSGICLDSNGDQTPDTCGLCDGTESDVCGSICHNGTDYGVCTGDGSCYICGDQNATNSDSNDWATSYCENDNNSCSSSSTNSGGAMRYDGENTWWTRCGGNKVCSGGAGYEPGGTCQDADADITDIVFYDTDGGQASNISIADTLTVETSIQNTGTATWKFAVNPAFLEINQDGGTIIDTIAGEWAWCYPNALASTQSGSCNKSKDFACNSTWIGRTIDPGKERCYMNYNCGDNDWNTDTSDYNDDESPVWNVVECEDDTDAVMVSNYNDGTGCDTSGDCDNSYCSGISAVECPTDLDSTVCTNADEPSCCSHYNYNWSSTASACCGDDGETDDWNGDSTFGCCCDGSPIATGNDEICSGYNDYWCIDGLYCSDEAYDSGQMSGTTLSGDDINCNCASGGQICDTTDAGAGCNGICADTTCDSDLVALSGGDYDSGCSASHECDSDVTEGSTCGYTRDGYCAGSSCAISVIAADNDGTECGSGTSGCTAHDFTGNDEVDNCNSGNEGTVCSTTPGSGSPPTANGTCVEDVCDTDTVRVNCSTDGCASSDLSDANMFGSCTTTSGDACDYDVGSTGFTQDGICSSGVTNSCNTEGFVCLHGGTYYADESAGSCSEGDQCDETFTDGDFSAGSKRYDPDNGYCDNCSGGNLGEDGNCEEACGADSECDEVAPNSCVSGGYCNSTCGFENLTAPSGLNVDTENKQPLNSELGNISLSWNDNSDGEDGFRIERKPMGGSFSEIDTVGEGVTSYEDSGIDDNTNYTYRVRAYSSSPDCNGSYSNNVSNVTEDRTGPASPNLTVTTDATNDEMELNWSEGDEGLLVYLPFEDITSTTDDWSPYKNTIAFQSDPSEEKGRYGNAVFLDGDDAINITSDLGNPTHMTLMLWFNTSDYNNGPDYIMDGRSGGNWWWLQDYTTEYCTDSGGNICFYNLTEVPSSRLSSNEWYHVAVTANSTETKIYLNGELIDTGNGLNPDLGSNVVIGTRFTQVNYWDGLMDEVRIYDRILTQKEIIDIYHSGLTTHALYRSDTFSGTYSMIDSKPSILVISHNESYDHITDYLESEGFNVTTDNSVDSVSAVDSYNPDIVMAEGYVWGAMRWNTLESSAGDALLNDIYEAGYAIFTQGNDQDDDIRPIDSDTSTGGSVDWDVLRDGSFDHPITEGWDEVGLTADSGHAITAIHSNAHSLGLMENNTDWYSFVYLQEPGKGKWVHAQSHMPASSPDRNRFLKNAINHLAGYVADNNYTDSDANDTTAPDVPTISAFGYNRTQINITWTNPSDNGDDFFYYMKAFDYEGSTDSLTGNIGFESGSGTDADEWDGEDTSGSAQEYRMASSELFGHHVINVSVTDHTSQFFRPLHQDYESLGLSSASDWELNTKNKTFIFMMDYFCVLDSTIFILMRDQDSPCCNDSLDDTHIPCSANESGRINITFTTKNIDNMDNYLSFGVSNASSGNWPMEVLFDNVEVYEIENDTLTTGFNELRIQNNATGWSDIVNDSSSPFEHGGLTPNTRYYYRAYSKDNQDNENPTPSSVVNNVTLAETPSVTGVLCAGSQAAGYHCNVTFNMGNNPAGTEHYIEETTGNTGGSDQDWTSSTAMYQDTGLVSHTQYCYRIKARNLNNIETGYSSQACNSTENIIPTHSNPLLNSTSGNNLTSDNLTCWNQSTFDGDGDDVTNVYNWYKNGQPIMVLNMPFDTNLSVNDVSSVTDYSGHGNNGMLKNFDFDADSGWTSSGRIGGAYVFDGSNDLINISDSASLEPSTITVELWAEWNNISDQWLLEKHNVSDPADYDNGYLIRSDSPSNTVRWRIGDGSTSTDITASITTGIFYHVVGTFNGTHTQLYVNGSLKGSSTAVSSINYTDVGNLFIGASNAGNLNFNGTIDQVKIYDHALSAGQIYTLYQESKDGYSYKSTIVSNETTGGEQWICEVTPTDGIGDGITKNSTALTVIGAGAGGHGTTCDSSNPCLFVENSTGVVARFDQFGYVDVKGSYSDSQSPPLAPPEGSFIVENSTGDVVMYIDKNGNIALLGVFNTQGSPSPSGGDDFIVQNSTDIAGYIDGGTGEMYFKGELHYNSDF